MQRLCVCLVWGAAALAQSPEPGRIERNGSQATLIIESPRPLDSAAITIAEQFGIPVSAEDPPYAYQDDVKDVSAEVARLANPLRRILVPKGGRLEVQFTLRPDGSPGDVRALLRDLVDRANSQFPFGHRLDDDGDRPVLVPTRTRDLLGRVVEITPLLDRRVTIPPGSRTIAASAKLMTDALSAQTGLRVSCCQGVVAGVPWGMKEVAFEARAEPARSVLNRRHGRPSYRSRQTRLTIATGHQDGSSRGPRQARPSGEHLPDGTAYARGDGVGPRKGPSGLSPPLL